MSEKNNEEKTSLESSTESTIEIKDSDFTWESLGSIENRKKTQIVSDIYKLRDINDERLEELISQWEELDDLEMEVSIENQFKRAVERYHQNKEKILSASEIKRDLVEKAEALKDSKDWRKTSAILKDYQKQWREAGYAGSTENDSLWEAFSSANDHFFENRNVFYEGLASSQNEAKQAKEDLITEAEKLMDSTDWKETSARYRDLMEEWKKTPFAGRSVDKELWERFNTARQTFYTRQNDHFEVINVERKAIIAAKEELIAESQALENVDNLVEVRVKMDSLLEKWKVAGNAGYRDDQKLWERFNESRNNYYSKLRALESENRYEQQQYNHEKINELNKQINTLVEVNQGLSEKIEALKDRLETENGNEEVVASLNQEISELQEFVDNNAKNIEAYQLELEVFKK